LQFAVIPVTPFRQNCSLVWCERTGKAALIDPGGESDHLLAAIARHGLTLDRLLLTHGHLDHVGAAGLLASQRGLTIEGPQIEDAFLLDTLPQQAALFGFPPTAAFRPQRWLHDGDTVSVGDITLHVLHCPGHTPGHVVFHHPESRIAFVGDVLFKGSIGRTDFERGDHNTLLDSIRNKLWPLGDDTRFIPGHGTDSTFGWERQHNPFVGDSN
jgi:hydroxyacylglutathione hydrolase